MEIRLDKEAFHVRGHAGFVSMSRISSRLHPLIRIRHSGYRQYTAAAFPVAHQRPETVRFASYRKQI